MIRQCEIPHELIAQPHAVRSMTLTEVNRHLVQGIALGNAFQKLESPRDEQLEGHLVAFIALDFRCHYKDFATPVLPGRRHPGSVFCPLGLGQKLGITPPEHDFDTHSFLLRARKDGCPVPPRLLPGSPHDDVFRVDARPVSFVDVLAETEEFGSRFGAARPILRFGTCWVVEMRFTEWIDVAWEEGQLVEMVLDEVVDLLGEFLPHHGADGGVVVGFEGGRRRSGAAAAGIHLLRIGLDFQLGSFLATTVF